MKIHTDSSMLLNVLKTGTKFSSSERKREHNSKKNGFHLLLLTDMFYMFNVLFSISLWPHFIPFNMVLCLLSFVLFCVQVLLETFFCQKREEKWQSIDNEGDKRKKKDARNIDLSRQMKEKNILRTQKGKKMVEDEEKGGHNNNIRHSD